MGVSDWVQEMEEEWFALDDSDMAARLCELFAGEAKSFAAGRDSTRFTPVYAVSTDDDGSVSMVVIGTLDDGRAVLFSSPLDKARHVHLALLALHALCPEALDAAIPALTAAGHLRPQDGADVTPCPATTEDGSVLHDTREGKP